MSGTIFASSGPSVVAKTTLADVKEDARCEVLLYVALHANSVTKY